MTLAKDLRAGLSIGIILLIAFLLLGCGSKQARPQPDVQLTGPDHVRVLPDGTVTEVGELKGLLRRRGYDKETTRELLQDARRQQEAYEAGMDRGRHNAESKARPSREAILWTARAMLSESAESEVREYVGWTVRNRIRSADHPDDARSVVLEPGAFSAFNDPAKRQQLAGLSPEHDSREWQRSLRMAKYVLSAPIESAPSRCITHFVMTDTQRKLHGAMPAWADDYRLEFMSYEGASRAAFYADGSLCTRQEPSPTASAR